MFSSCTVLVLNTELVILSLLDLVLARSVKESMAQAHDRTHT